MAGLVVVPGDRNGLARSKTLELRVRQPRPDLDPEGARPAEIDVEDDIDLAVVAIGPSGGTQRDDCSSARMALAADAIVVGVVGTSMNRTPEPLDHVTGPRSTNRP